MWSGGVGQPRRGPLLRVCGRSGVMCDGVRDVTVDVVRGDVVRSDVVRSVVLGTVVARHW